MPKYMIQASYNADGVEGLLNKGGSSRRDAVDQAVRGLGGSLESFYFAFGEHDVYAIVDLPDNEAATAVALSVNGTRAVTANTVVLLTPEQVDDATKRSVDYSPPGS
jgi:uncharacterized protein with GYD domain